MGNAAGRSAVAACHEHPYFLKTHMRDWPKFLITGREQKKRSTAWINPLENQKRGTPTRWKGGNMVVARKRMGVKPLSAARDIHT